MNQSLLKDYTANDVWLVLIQMCHLKATNPNGMPPLFFQHFWSKSGEMQTKMVLDFLHLGVSSPNFNETHIVLIPKINEPKQVTDYRPISLCYVMYKIATKTIANRLKKIYLLLLVILRVLL